MHTFPSIAIVGRPNVGKSRLFNRLAGRRISIVHDRPGVTRDVVAADLDGYTLLDTGGIGLGEVETPQAIREAMEEQVFVAVQTSGLVLLTVDIREGVVPLDLTVADRLRSARAKVMVVANKCDTRDLESGAWEFAKLGFGDPIPVSAEHDRGVVELWERIRELLPPGTAALPSPSSTDRRIELVFTGRPNVGKSSLANRLLKEKRVIVSDIPGTTRETVAIDLDWKGRGDQVLKFRLLDTAGLRRKGKMDTSLEYFSSLRTEGAVDRADVAVLVLDASSGVTKQDQVIAGRAWELGKAVVVAVNKWDKAKVAISRDEIPGYSDERAYREDYEKRARAELFFLSEVPFVFISAASGMALERLLRACREIDRQQERAIRTGHLNRFIQAIVDKHPPKKLQGKLFKIYYGVQTGVRPLRFRLYCNHHQRLEVAYQRYFERELLNALNLQGLPVRLDWVDRGKVDSPGRSRTGGH